MIGRSRVGSGTTWHSSNPGTPFWRKVWNFWHIGRKKRGGDNERSLTFMKTISVPRKGKNNEANCGRVGLIRLCLRRARASDRQWGVYLQFGEFFSKPPCNWRRHMCSLSPAGAEAESRRLCVFWMAVQGCQRSTAQHCGVARLSAWRSAAAARARLTKSNGLFSYQPGPVRMFTGQIFDFHANCV